MEIFLILTLTGHLLVLMFYVDKENADSFVIVSIVKARLVIGFEHHVNQDHLNNPKMSSSTNMVGMQRASA